MKHNKITEKIAFFENINNNYKASIRLIKSMLSLDELEIIPAMTLCKFPTKNVLAYCENVKRGRRTPFAKREVVDFNFDFGPDNEFLSEVHALLIRKVTPEQFLEFDEEKQELLTFNGFVFHLMDKGVEFKKIAALNNHDLKALFDWLASDRDRLIGLAIEGYGDLLNQANQFIESKLSLSLSRAQVIKIQEAYDEVPQGKSSGLYATRQESTNSAAAGDTINITEQEFIFLGPEAEDVDVPLAYLAECYKNDSDKRYDKIAALRTYLKNHKNGEEPALSLQEVLAIEDQERINLQSGYRLIKDKFMTMENVRALSEEERMVIVMAGYGENEEAIRNLAEYRKVNHIVVANESSSVNQIKSLPQSAIGEVSSTLFRGELVRMKTVNIEAPPFITAMAERTGLSPDYIMDCFKRDKKDNDYSSISMLQLYLENHNKNDYPALSLPEVLKTSPQESINLNTAYRIIKEKLMTIDEAKSLSEEERMILVYALASMYAPARARKECEAAVEELETCRARRFHI